MGNENKKTKKVVPKFTSPPTLDELPVEIIYKIFDELDTCTIFSSLNHVCKRFDKIISNYSEYHLNFSQISLNQLNRICSIINPEQVTKITLSDDTNNPGLIELFLSKYSINKFTRLRSLTLIKITNEELVNQILISIADRHSFLNFNSIKIINNDEAYEDLFTEVLMTVLSKPSIRRVYLDLSYSRTGSNPLPWLDQSSIKQLTFESTCTMNFIRSALICLPELETLTVDDLDFDEESNSLQTIDWNNHSASTLSSNDGDGDDDDAGNEENKDNQVPRKERFTSIEGTNNLKSLTLNSFSMNMLKLEWILEEIPTLKKLRLTTTNSYDDESILDASRWENLLTNIDKFEFIFSIRITDTSEWNIDTCITKFQTPFWVNDKKWFVTLEKCDDDILLYTLPYLNYYFVLKTESTSCESRSTIDQNSILNIQSMNNVRDLYIDTANMKKSQFQNENSPRFLHIKNLSLYGKWPKSKTFFPDIKTIVDFNTVEELVRDEPIPTTDFTELLNLMPNLKSIKTTTTLLDALNAAKFCYTTCLQSFKLESFNYEDQRPVNIEPFCAMFPRIQYLTIPVDSVDSCQYVLDQLKQDLISVNFRIPPSDENVFSDEDDEVNENGDENKNDDTFSEWIKELPKQYRCQKKDQQVHIWIK